MTTPARVPEVPGVLTAAQVQETAAAVARVQQPDGGIPWAVGEHIDVWNHVEAAMALLAAGQVEASEAAYEWVRRRQRADGTWPMKIIGEAVEDDAAETNMCAYLAVGVWHHWLVRRDLTFVQRLWPVVRGGLDYVASMQAPFGGISWCREVDGSLREAGGTLLAGSSSIYHSFRAGLSLADLVQEPQPDWEVVAGGLRHALEAHRDMFMDKSTFSMDWYYPVLGGPVRGREAYEMFESRWKDFVVEGLGCRCVDTNPWITGAETCELVLALDNVGDRDRALALFRDIQHSRHESGLYWTGYVFPEGVWWPNEQTTYTSAAVILAADALSGATSGAGIFRGDLLPAEPRPMPLQCGCDERVVSGSFRGH